MIGIAKSIAVVVHLSAGGTVSYPVETVEACINEADFQSRLKGNDSAECRVVYYAPHFITSNPSEDGR